MKFLYIFLAVYVGLIAGNLLFNAISKVLRKRRDRRTAWTVLSIRVPRENEAGPIVAEQIYSALHGVYRDLSLLQCLFGYGQDRISFEIANIGQSIQFYAAFPSRLKNLVEGQIYAQYPDVEIMEVKDYALPTERTAPSFKNAVGAELELDAPLHDPIKRWPQFEDKLTRIPVDPIAGLTAALTKFSQPDEQAWIQIVFAPLEDKWRYMFQKSLRIQSKGILANIETLQDYYSYAFCTRKTIYRIIFFPIYFIFWIQGLLSGTKVSLMQGKVEAQFEEETSRLHERETMILGAYDKVVRLLFDANVRVVYIPMKRDPEVSNEKIREIAGAFKQFNLPHLNGFRIREIYMDPGIIEKYKNRELEEPMTLSNEELATLYHMPTEKVATPMIEWVKSRKLEPPSDLPTPQIVPEEDFTLLGKTNFRGVSKEFGIMTTDRRRHVYIIGKTGMGKSTLLENMIFSDIQSGKGVGVIDPHGDLADAVLNFIPSKRTNDVVVFDPSDRDFPVAFNMLENVDPSFNTIVASGLVGIFKKIYAESWGPRLEHILRNTILALLEYPNTTMLGIPRILQDEDFRERVVRKITDPIVKSFWVTEFARMTDKLRIEAISPIQNKVGQFLSSPIIRNIVGQPKSSIDLRFMMDKKKIIIVNLSKGKIGEDSSSLLGAMLITKFQLDAMSRANIPEKDRTDFYLYVDEFQNFATESFATILSEARKYKLNITMANQYIAQMPEEVRDAVFGNVGTTIAFQVGFDDAEYISEQFAEQALPADLVSLSKYTAYTKLLIDGMPSKTFSLDTLPPPAYEKEEDRREKVMKMSRERYSAKREIVEDKIRRWSESVMKKMEEKAGEKKEKKSGHSREGGNPVDAASSAA